jgi:hypothetical protein
VFVVYDSYSKQWLFPYTAFTDRSKCKFNVQIVIYKIGFSHIVFEQVFCLSGAKRFDQNITVDFG